MFTEVLAALRARDAQDMGREEAPLVVAEDAVVVDTSELSIQQATDAVLALVRER